ncbi:TnsA-like heteromeric transposase endonuclease subunit [Arthrobacter sp. NyZ413]|uniref:TnsA-like heteromeric transposase endonuclease subunit n=1 Tax=Arthrobacter sp. NyZ413 TaxID=3144669 RepID=UPI003BF83583
MNATGSVRVLGRFEAGMLDAALSDDVASERFESALPVRSFFAWPGKRNYEGSWWSSTVRAHVGFESLLEREFLMSADYDKDVVGISSQPFALLWPKGTEGARGHVPDFFLRLADGTGRVVAVRHPDRLASAQRQSNLTREACEQVGWEYEVFTGLSEPLASNIRWLAGYRQDRFAPPASAIPAIVEAFSPATSLAAGARRAARLLKLDFSMAQAYAMNLVFTGSLDADLRRPLSLDATVSPVQEFAQGTELEAVS